MLAGVEEDDVSAFAVDFAASPEVLDACPRAVSNGAANVTKSATSDEHPGPGTHTATRFHAGTSP